MSQQKPGILVLIRHGQSEWNAKKLFTGWEDPDLTEKGAEEAQEAGKKLADYRFDVGYTSLLKRAIKTLDLALENMRNPEFPVIRDEALNERHYGDLQGKNKDQVKEEVGQEQFHIWRRGYDTPPPNGESLKDTAERTLPYFDNVILKDIREGKNVIVSAHGNSLRAVLMELEQISVEDIPNLNIPTGIPYIYEFNDDMSIKSKTILE